MTEEIVYEIPIWFDRDYTDEMADNLRSYLDEFDPVDIYHVFMNSVAFSVQFGLFYIGLKNAGHLVVDIFGIDDPINLGYMHFDFKQESNPSVKKEIHKVLKDAGWLVIPWEDQVIKFKV